MPNIANAVSGAISDATNLRKVLATTVIVVAVLFYLQSGLPGAASIRSMIGSGGTTSG